MSESFWLRQEREIDVTTSYTSLQRRCFHVYSSKVAERSYAEGLGVGVL